MGWIERYLKVRLPGRCDVKDDSGYLVNIVLAVWLLVTCNTRGRGLGRTCKVWPFKLMD